MRFNSKLLLTLFSLLIFPILSYADCSPLLEFESKKLHSKKTVNFCEKFNNKVLLVVNTASQCGFTPQFEELEILYQKYKDQGLEIVGFPSNDFNQEYKSEAETASMCFKNFGVSFTMVATSPVKGPSQNAFYKELTEKAGKEPSWNFNKYLISKDQQSIVHFGSSTKPLNSSLEELIIQSLSSQ
ncbi:MAG: glutathione peroxidase [Oleispira antarctica]|uniref:Glutathione peroxidase n=1 Tax=Oleispira antarctica RB-8 TaxID=698738 RepID=R4YK44_OLEAN|nr:glutathione peroxidase [Oleispira antarctica]MBQ0792695.1 glutathione peroxidase [Oleispira antarctica]CCK74717.1 Glutathione peroxidase [Oleispira antarctica RB-8]